MPRPPKPHDLLVLEGKSHRTLAELEQRKEGEQELLTGQEMQPHDDLTAEAKKKFERVKELLKKIGKDDALYEDAVNEYAMLYTESRKLQKLISKETEAQNIAALDRQLQAKRKMMLDLQKEMAMTLAAALRMIPKKVEKVEKPTGIAAFKANRG